MDARRHSRPANTQRGGGETRSSAARFLATMLLSAAVCTLAGFCCSWAASGEASEEGILRVKLGETTALPGTSVILPIYFTPDPQTPLRSLSMEIEFVSNNLKFQKAAEGVFPGINVKAVATERAPDDKGISRTQLQVSLSLDSEKSDKGRLTEGALAYLAFDLSDKAKPFMIKLNTTLLSAEDTKTPSHQVSKVTIVPGTVTVEAADAPQVSCFFFSH